MRYILLVGVADDPVLVYVANKCIDIKLPLIWIDQNQLGVTLYCKRDCWVKYKTTGEEDWVIKHDQVRSVYSRVAGLDYKLANKSQILEFELLIFMLNYYYPQVINRPKDNLTNFAKFNQLFSLRRYQFRLPITRLLANIPCEKDNWIYKSVSSYRSIVKSTKTLTRNGFEPVLYQQLISGDNVRVHVVDGECIAIKIKSKIIDYRYSLDIACQQIKLPNWVRLSCIDIARELNLIFCGIDLIEQTGEWYLLEVNPAPGFNFFETKINSNIISSKLMQYFIGTL